MKLSAVILAERIPETGTCSFRSEHYDLSYESGMVTILRREKGPSEMPFLIPMSNVRMMRPMPESAKAAAK